MRKPRGGCGDAAGRMRLWRVRDRTLERKAAITGPTSRRARRAGRWLFRFLPTRCTPTLQNPNNQRPNIGPHNSIAKSDSQRSLRWQDLFLCNFVQAKTTSFRVSSRQPSGSKRDA